MRCDEIQERFVELLYCESGTPSASSELKDHVRSCPSCRKELEELKSVQGFLKAWPDQRPLRPVTLPKTAAIPRHPRFAAAWQISRYAAIAAMAAIAFLALANIEITWSKEGFSLRTHLFTAADRQSEYYTKREVRDIIRRVLDDSEARITETNFLMMQRLMDTVEQERWMDLRLVRDQFRRSN